MTVRNKSAGIIAALCASLVLSGCCSGGSKSTISTRMQELRGTMNVPESGDGLSHEALLEQLRGGGSIALPGGLSKAVSSASADGAVSTDTVSMDTVATLKAKLKAAEETLEAADLETRLKAAQARIAELERASATEEPAESETPAEGDGATPAEGDGETPSDGG